MKNIYELEVEEKNKFRGEFNKLKFTKDVNVVRGPALFIAMFGMIACGILTGMIEDGVNLQVIYDIVQPIVYLAFVVFVLLEIYLNISFKRWMKIKHKIEY
jgi:hypothetical protein